MMKMSMLIRIKYNAVEVWLDINNQRSLFLDLYNTGQRFCNSGNIKRTSKLYPTATKTFASFKI